MKALALAGIERLGKESAANQVATNTFLLHDIADLVLESEVSRLFPEAKRGVAMARRGIERRCMKSQRNLRKTMVDIRSSAKIGLRGAIRTLTGALIDEMTEFVRLRHLSSVFPSVEIGLRQSKFLESVVEVSKEFRRIDERSDRAAPLIEPLVARLQRLVPFNDQSLWLPCDCGIDIGSEVVRIFVECFDSAPGELIDEMLAERRRALGLAFACSMHPRLAADSPARIVGRDVLEAIIRFASEHKPLEPYSFQPSPRCGERVTCTVCGESYAGGTDPELFGCRCTRRRPVPGVTDNIDGDLARRLDALKK